MKRITMFVSVFSLIIFVFSVMLVSCALSSCANSADHVDIYGRSSAIFDNIQIDLPEGYFLVRYDKNRIDDTHVDLVLHFSSNDTGNGWD